MSDDYWCYQCQEWKPEEEVDRYNEMQDPDGDGPTVCPDCGHEVVWWSSPDGQAVLVEQRASEKGGTAG